MIILERHKLQRRKQQTIINEKITAPIVRQNIQAICFLKFWGYCLFIVSL